VLANKKYLAARSQFFIQSNVTEVKIELIRKINIMFNNYILTQNAEKVT